MPPRAGSGHQLRKEYFVSYLTQMTDDLALLLREGIGALSAQLRQRFAEPDGSGPGFVALATLRHLRRNGPRTVTSLAASDRVTTQAVSLRIRPLEQAGLVVRARDREDGRRTVVTPTAAGIAVLDASEHRVDDALRSALSRLSPKERLTLSRAAPVLRDLAAHLAEVTS